MGLIMGRRKRRRREGYLGGGRKQISRDLDLSKGEDERHGGS
jgi:hypothetical protein